MDRFCGAVGRCIGVQVPMDAVARGRLLLGLDLIGRYVGQSAAAQMMSVLLPNDGGGKACLRFEPRLRCAAPSSVHADLSGRRLPTHERDQTNNNVITSQVRAGEPMLHLPRGECTSDGSSTRRPLGRLFVIPFFAITSMLCVVIPLAVLLHHTPQHGFHRPI